MKAAVYHGPLDVRVEEVPEPGPLGPDEVLVAPLVGSLCGTDVSEFLAGPKRIPLHHAHSVSGHQGPVVLGHEFMGIVVEVGAAVTDLHIGLRVVPGAGMWCGRCPLCLTGRSNICERAVLYGIHTHGGLAERVKVPARMCVAVPETCSDEAAALAQPCAVAIHALGRVGIEAGQHVALFGVGGIGGFLLAALLARTQSNLSLIVVEVDGRKRHLIERLGASASTFVIADELTETAIREQTRGSGVDLVIEASGSPIAVQQALSVVRSGGTLLQVGIPTGRVSLSLGQIVPCEVSIIMTNGMVCDVDLPLALALLSRIDLATQITDRIVPLDALVEEGLEPLALHEVLGKVLVRMQTLVESRQTYLFRLQTKEGATPRIVYDYPIEVRAHPDWEEFKQRLAALHADHFTLVVDAGLPKALVEPVYRQVRALGVPCLLVPLHASEKAKLMQTALDVLYQARAHGGGTHASCFIALGGGLVGNITGLAASLVVRGIRLVHIPTTLLAATDSILSCKQGVNGEPTLDLLIKNLVGTFKAPEFALVYLSFWQSLAPDEIRSGLCELVKNVLAIHPHRHEEVAALLNPEAKYSLDQSAQVFTWCFEAKQAVMRQDAHEQGTALVLEAGHTVGHALESLLGMKHGLAVALGLLVEAHISHARGWLSDTEVRQHYALLGRNGVPTTLPQTLDLDALMRIIRDDNKIGYLPRREDCHVIVLLRHLGQPVEERPGLPLTYVSEAELRTALATLRA